MLSLSHTRHGTMRPARRRRLRDYLALLRQRRDLASLDDRMLRDIGLSRRDADAEARRPVWDAPNTWHD